MKTYFIRKHLTMVLILLMTGTVLMAQEKESKEAGEQAAMEEEMKIRKDLLEDQEQEMKEQQQKMKQVEIQFAEQARSAERSARASARSSASSRSSGSSWASTPYVYSGFYGDEHHVTPMIVQNSQSQLTLRNSFNGGSDESKGDFEVDEGTRNFRVMINGKVKSGEIQVVIKYPNGKVFKDLTINSAAEITFSQSLTIKEEENSKYIGSWKYEVKAASAEGNYMLQIMTH